MVQGRAVRSESATSKDRIDDYSLLKDQLFTTVTLADLTTHDSVEKTLAWAIILNGNPTHIFALDTRLTVYGCEVCLKFSKDLSPKSLHSTKLELPPTIWHHPQLWGFTNPLGVPLTRCGSHLALRD